MENITHANSLRLCRYKVALKTRTRDKKGHSIMMKGSVQGEDIIVLNMCISNNRDSRYMKQKPMVYEDITEHTT